MEKVQCNGTNVDLLIQGGHFLVAAPKIVYIESNAHRVLFHILDNAGELREYYIYDSLNHVQEEIEQLGFIRVHQSYLINKTYIKNAYRYRVELTNGLSLCISKKYYKSVKDYYMQMLKEN